MDYDEKCSVVGCIGALLVLVGITWGIIVACPSVVRVPVGLVLIGLVTIGVTLYVQENEIFKGYDDRP